MLQNNRIPRRLLLCALCAVLALLCGCASEDMSSVIARESISGIGIRYMGYIGDDIPSAEVTNTDPAFSSILNALFASEPVSLDVSQSQSYSPEMNAAYILYLHTEQGSMPVYLDEYHHIFSLPVMRSQDEQSVRTYVTYQPVSAEGGISPVWDVIASLEPVRQEPQTILNSSAEQTVPIQEQSPDLTGFVPEDDTALREGVDPSLISQSGETIPFESSSNSNPAGPLYYAFAPGTLDSITDGRIYIAACPGLSQSQTVSISSITKVEGALLVRIQFNEREDQNQNAALIDPSVLTDGMKVVFLRDDNAEILYVQSYALPAEG